MTQQTDKITHQHETQIRELHRGSSRLLNIIKQLQHKILKQQTAINMLRDKTTQLENKIQAMASKLEHRR